MNPKNAIVAYLKVRRTATAKLSYFQQRSHYSRRDAWPSYLERGAQMATVPDSNSLRLATAFAGETIKPTVVPSLRRIELGNHKMGQSQPAGHLHNDDGQVQTGPAN